MKPTPLGAFVAGAMSAVARVLGVVIFYALRITYRPRERAIAIAVVALVVAIVALLVWML